MTLTIFLNHFIRIVYTLLGVISVITYLSQRTRVRLDIALAFGLIGAFNGLQEYLFVMGTPATWVIARLLQSISIAHAYLILRLIQHFRTVPAWVQRATVAGLILLLAANWVLPAWPSALSLLMLVYLAAVDTYSLVALVQGALAARGVTRRRLQFGALGAGSLATLLILALLVGLVPALLPAVTLLIEFIAVLSGLAFYVAFAPPRSLRRAWQLAELESFLNATAAAPPDAPVPEALQRLATAAVRAVGGRAALVLAPPGWQVVVATDDSLSAAVSAANRPADYWQQIAGGQARYEPRLDSWFQPAPSGRFLAEAQSALAIPLNTSRRAWGLLVVLLRRGALFPDDDLHLLELLKDQFSLIIEQQTLIGDLRRQTRELEQANRAFERSNRELESANRELEAFTYSVSHDLRTPLRHIEGFTQLLADSQTVAVGGRRYLDNIVATTARMGHLIDALLALSRLGRADLTLTQVSLEALVQQLRADLETDLRHRQVTWQIGPLPVVTGDPILLRQVFANLVANALKFTRPRRDARIEIGSAPSLPHEVVVYVRDNGVGFDPQYAHRLFTVFQRLHHASEFEGDGVGLANVRRIIQRHGGRVWAESQPDAGATFYFSLPLEPVKAASASPPELSQAAAAPPAPPAAGQLQPDLARQQA